MNDLVKDILERQLMRLDDIARDCNPPILISITEAMVELAKVLNDA